MILEQFYLGCLSHASYVIADEESGEAMIVDPQRDIDTYSEFLAEHKLILQGTILTHFHADFIAGHIELHEHYDIPIYLNSNADANFEFEGLDDGQELKIGRIRVTALATPGHTPEGMSLLVHDESGKPHAVLTGDTLFIGDVGRPDLLASIGYTADQLADMLYDSLHQKLLPLADDVLVYPAHGAGSLCGKNLSNETVSTIGAQRQENYALQKMSREKFKELVTADQPDSPQYFLHDATMNKQDRQTIDELLERAHHAIDIEELRRRAAVGEQIVDIRDETDVHQAYYRPAVNIGLEGKYATWAGSILSYDTPITVITDPHNHEEAIMRLGRIGYDNVNGYIIWDDIKDQLTPAELASTRRVSADNLMAFFRDNDVQIIDIRSPREFEAEHLPDAENIPLHKLAETMADRDRSQAYLVHCAGGYRSSAGVTLLQSLGFENIYDLEGGLKPAYVEQLQDLVLRREGSGS